MSQSKKLPTKTSNNNSDTPIKATRTQPKIVNEIKPYLEETILHTISDKASKHDNKVSLLNVLRNSIINNDIQSFEWTINQENEAMIHNTIKKMDIELIKAFIAKSVELLQSMRANNIVTWLKLILSHHKQVIATLPRGSLENLRQLQLLIANRVKNYKTLVETKAKLDCLLSAKSIEGSKEKKYEALLIYNESDSEDDIKMKGIWEYKYRNYEERKCCADYKYEGILFKEARGS
jgi:hypothetical protein